VGNFNQQGIKQLPFEPLRELKDNVRWFIVHVDVAPSRQQQIDAGGARAQGVLNDRIGETLDDYILAEHGHAQMADGSRELAQMMEQAERILIRAEIRNLGTILAFTGPH